MRPLFWEICEEYEEANKTGVGKVTCGDIDFEQNEIPTELMDADIHPEVYFFSHDLATIERFSEKDKKKKKKKNEHQQLNKELFKEWMVQVSDRLADGDKESP